MISNTTSLTTEQCNNLEMIWQFRNNWRQRIVTIYKHPTDSTKVITLGVSFDRENIYWCCEEINDYEIIITNKIKVIN